MCALCALFTTSVTAKRLSFVAESQLECLAFRSPAIIWLLLYRSSVSPRSFLVVSSLVCGSTYAPIIIVLLTSLIVLAWMNSCISFGACFFVRFRFLFFLPFTLCPILFALWDLLFFSLRDFLFVAFLCVVCCWFVAVCTISVVSPNVVSMSRKILLFMSTSPSGIACSALNKFTWSTCWGSSGVIVFPGSPPVSHQIEYTEMYRSYTFQYTQSLD